MIYRNFGKTGLRVSVVGFGAAPAAYLKSDQDLAAGMIESLLDRGVVMEETLGFSLGHAELRSMVKRVLRTLEASAGKAVD